MTIMTVERWEPTGDSVALMLELLTDGVPAQQAAAAAGISWPRLSAFLASEEGEVLHERMEQARSRAVAQYVRAVRKSAHGGYVVREVQRTLPDGSEETEKAYAPPQWKAAAWLLETQWPQSWGRRNVPLIEAGTYNLVGDQELPPHLQAVLDRLTQAKGSIEGPTIDAEEVDPEV